MKEVYYTKFRNNVFYSLPTEKDIVVTDNFDYENYDVIKKKYFSSDLKTIGIRAIICFIEGKYNEEEFWKKYNLDPVIFSQIQKIQEFLNLEPEEYHLLSEELQYQFGFEYIKLIKNLYNDYFHYYKELDHRALRIYDETKISLKRLEFNNPFLIIKKNLDLKHYQNFIYKIGNFSFLKVKYSQERTVNGLITSYDRSINTISSVDPIRECVVSKFGHHGKILSVDYNAFQPRIIFSLAGYNINYQDDFYIELLKEFDIKLDREAFKLFFLKTLYNATPDSLAVIQKIFPKVSDLIANLNRDFDLNGYIKSITGRRRIVTKQEQTKFLNSYTQMNHSDIISEMIVKLDHFLLNKKSKLIGFISDNFLLDVYNEEEDEVKDFMINNLQKSDYLPNCFLKLNFLSGNSWANIK